MFEPIPVIRNATVRGKHPGEVVEGMLRRYEEISFANLFASFTNDLETLHGQYFASEQDPDGTPWAELSPATIAAKRHDDILRDTDSLFNSLVESNAPDAVRNFFEVGNQQLMQYGTSVEYAHFHMTGVGNMPARPMVGVSDAVVDAMAEQAADYVLGVMVEGAL